MNVDSSKTVLMLGSFFYPILLGGIYYLMLGMPKWPPQGFFTAIPFLIVSFACFAFIPVFEKWIEVVILNGLIYLAFTSYGSSGFVVLIGARIAITVLFLMLFSVALNSHFILTKLFHSAALLALLYFALKLGQAQIASLALICSVSVLTGVILKLVFWSKTPPNLSRPIIDLGIPLLLAWLLIDQAGLAIFDLELGFSLNPLNYLDLF